MISSTFTVFVHLKADISWLALSRKKRDGITQKEVFPLLQKYPELSHQHFDAEAFCGSVSDIEMFTCCDPKQFYFFFEEFRDSIIISSGYFKVIEIYPAYADGYNEFDARVPASRET